MAPADGLKVNLTLVATNVVTSVVELKYYSRPVINLSQGLNHFYKETPS